MHFNSKLVLTLLTTLPSTFAAVNGRCTGKTGICIATGTCSKYGGSYASGYCPKDANNIRCCDNIPCRADDGRSGHCVFTDQCSGDKISGKCPGGSDFKCCVSPKPVDTGVGSSCSDQGVSGKCIDINKTGCDTLLVSNRCPGASNVKCCLSKVPGVGNPCNGVAGTCIDTQKKSCGYDTIPNKCPGPDRVRCCPDKVKTGHRCTGANGICVDTRNSSSCHTTTLKGKCPNDPDFVRCCPDKEPEVKTGHRCTGANGICVDTRKSSSCHTTTLIGKCPNDPDFVRCCPDKEPEVKTGHRCTGANGICVDTRDSSSCHTTTLKGKCPNDPDFVRCCPDKEPEVKTGHRCTGANGICVDTRDSSSCHTTTLKGKCPNDPDFVRCCPENNSQSNPDNGGGNSGNSGNSGNGGNSSNNAEGPGAISTKFDGSKLSKSEFVTIVSNYCSSHPKEIANEICQNIGLVYDTSKSVNVNPELVITKAMAEGNSPGISRHNYWGMGCGNEGTIKDCITYKSLEDGVKGFGNNVTKYKNLSEMMGSYSHIGKYWYNPGDWGHGGCKYFPYIKKYMSKERQSTVTEICNKSTTCDPKEGGDCTETISEDQVAYSTWQVQDKLGPYMCSLFNSCY